ncbi:MAG: endonuclease VIII [Clostridiaceae bacterium]|nr:endonuclease VIII [Clostridiaceae bacterium]
MLEFPETATVAKQIEENIIGKRIKNVMPPTKAHKFCWYLGDPADYGPKLKGAKVLSAKGFGIFVEISFDNGEKLCFNDGVNIRLADSAEVPQNYQLMIELEGGSALVFTVAMYGSIILHSGDYENEYYVKSKTALSPLSGEFGGYYRKLLEESKPSLSTKAFLATEQRFPGIGNGVLQDILFEAGIHPKRKIASLDAEEQGLLLSSIVSVLCDMASRGGRDTEKDLFGQPGGYRTKLSKNTLAAGCPRCGGKIVKEAYLGGSVYYCPSCQPLEGKR